MSMHSVSYKRVLKKLEEASREDYHFSEGRILSSMCTKPHQIAIKAHKMFLESNLGNPGLYPGTKKLEFEVIKMLGSLLHGSQICGHILNGGTEANITALWIAKKITGKKEIIMPKSAHFSFLKACDLMSFKPVVVNLDENYRMDIDDAKRKFSDNTCAVVGIAGTTELGVIDPLQELSDICKENYYLHVDAAFGGFVIPFLKELGYDRPEFDFKLKGVCSIAVDPHKMGLATIPAGALLVRDEKYFEHITRETPYLIGKQTCLAGTRCSAGVASTYAVMKYLGRNGYKKIVKNCMEATEYLCERVGELGMTLAIKPIMNIVGIKVTNPERIIKKLSRKNWKISMAKEPECLRIVVMPHVTKKVINKFIPDLEAVCRKMGAI